MFWERFYSLCLSNQTKPLTVVKELSIAAGSITKWKNNTVPNGETLMKIADYFNVSIDYLLGKTDIPQPPSLDEQLSGELFALYDEVHDLTNEEKQKVLDFIKFTKSQRKD